jgi:hypothetical protein
MLRFQNGAIGTIHLDYLQQQLVRNCLITGYEGSIAWDLANTKVSWINKDKHKEEFDYTGFERNDRFVEIVRSFLQGNEDSRLTSLQAGIKSLKLVMAAKYSAENSVFIEMDNFPAAI